MAQVTERAHAKINLSLRILGRRSDGYHELQSLVVFADIGDRLTLDPGGVFSLSVSGPFAHKIDGGNLVERVCTRVRDDVPDINIGAFHLEKNLPVAAGIGGGSADAAAALRALQSMNAAISDSIDWMALAACIGADVPVCFVGQSAIMEGIGERITPVGNALPDISLLLVNSGVAISTAEIFGLLDASRLQADRRVDAYPLDGLSDFDGLVLHLLQWGNDLEGPAVALCPEIADIKVEISGQEGCAYGALSGSGATCFGVFKSHALAVEAERRMSADHPDWWVKAAMVV